jgi:phosphoribosylformylglycinamidine synthase
LDLELEKKLQDALLQAADEGLIQSLHDCSDGGLFTTIAECCFGGYPNTLGCELTWEGSQRPDAFLFGESQSRYVLTCVSDSLSRIKEIFEFHQVPYHVLGKTGGREFHFQVDGKNLIRLSVQELYDIWYNSIANLLR